MIIFFGDTVEFERGSDHHAKNLRRVKGVLVGAKGNQVSIRLLQDDPQAIGGVNKAGQVGIWERSAIKKVLTSVF